MKYFDRCPILQNDGSDCWREPHPASRFGICPGHWREVVTEWDNEAPSVTLRCMHCQYLVSIDSVELGYARCEYCHKAVTDVELQLQLIEHERPISGPAIPIELPQPRGGVVYYLRFGDRVKIGYSSNLDLRVRQIPHDEIVAAEPGSFTLERRRHSEFSPERIKGQREWFQLTPRLAFHMANIRDKHGKPLKVEGLLPNAA